jgi:hypothetical protein
MENQIFIQQIAQMVRSTPNDQELGEKIRKLFENLKTNV